MIDIDGLKLNLRSDKFGIPVPLLTFKLRNDAKEVWVQVEPSSEISTAYLSLDATRVALTTSRENGSVNSLCFHSLSTPAGMQALTPYLDFSIATKRGSRKVNVREFIGPHCAKRLVSDLHTVIEDDDVFITRARAFLEDARNNSAMSELLKRKTFVHKLKSKAMQEFRIQYDIREKPMEMILADALGLGVTLDCQ